MRYWQLGLLVVAGIALAAMLFPVFARQRDGHDPETLGRHRCLGNVKNLAMAIQIYLTDYDALPEPARWCDEISEYVRRPDVYHCYQAPALRSAYALNTGAVGANEKMAASPSAARLIVIFESDVGWNAHGGGELLPTPPRHLGGENFGFLDGHARWIERGDWSRVQWSR
jgi:prepilin-type processing-associated H-X9-DG protein